MKRIHPSGAQKRKQKKAKAEEAKSQAGSLSKYFSVREEKEGCDGNSSNSAKSSLDVHVIDAVTTNSRNESAVCDSNEDDVIDTGEGDADNNEEITGEEHVSNDSDFDFSAFNDAAHWPVPVPQHIRIMIIEKGSEVYQHKEGPFEAIERSGDNIKGAHRCLSSSWFYSHLNETKYLRKWMLYSPSTKKLYCFCCRLFATEGDTKTRMNVFISGFCQWWKLNPKVSQHESSPEHLSNLEKWKTLSMGLKLGKTVDKNNLKIVNDETKKWRNILHRLFDVTLFLAQQNLAFRGHREDVSSENRGNFLELVKLLAKYDPVLREHCLKLEETAGGSKRVPSYLSKGIQNEFIFCLGEHVKKKIIADIKKAKYYGIILDSTPDESRTDQMSKIIRYVHVEDDNVEVRESFLGFFLMSGKSADDMSKDIQQELEKDGLDIKLCRAQGYDNAASMSGVHGGVQRKIREVNPKALFSPCSNHSLNLCGVHAFSCVPSSVTCFGTVEKLYSFFSSSTHRWEVLMEKTGKSLKRLSDTRWSAHYDSVKAVKENLETIVSTLEDMQDPSLANLDTRSAASLLLPAICDFTFLTYLQFWHTILMEVNLVQQYLQSPKMTLDKGLTKLNALNEFLVTERDTIIDNAVTFGTKKCEDMDINIERRGRRRLKKTMPDELARDAGLSIQEEVRRSMFECIDRFIQELSQRYTAMKEINKIFQIVETKFMLEASNDALAIAAHNLMDVYDEFDEEQVLLEIKRYRRHLCATETSVDIASRWTAQEVLQFIIKWDFSESLPSISLILQYFLTICVSVASCERSFSKLKLIKNYLRSTMHQERLVNLSILSIERKVSKELDFTEVIEDFSKMKARKHNI